MPLADKGEKVHKQSWEAQGSSVVRVVEADGNMQGLWEQDCECVGVFRLCQGRRGTC